MIVIDGAHGEGGGALVRTALAMSALTQQPVRISTVRGSQPFQGLQPEDLLIIDILRQSTRAETTGAEPGSQEFSFLPTTSPRSVTARLDPRLVALVEPHANALVVANALLPVLARSGGYSTLDIVGETFANGALGFDSFFGPTLALFRRIGLYVIADQLEAGFGRASSGTTHVEIEPSAIEGIKWTDRGELRSIQAVISFAGLDEMIAERGRSFLERLAHSASVDVDIEIERVKSLRAGVHFTIWADFERGIGGSQTMGLRGVRMETIVQRGFGNFMDWLRSDATLDDYLADQCIVALAVAEGDSEFKVVRLTSRLLTSIWVIKQFLPIHITVKGKEGEKGTVTIRR